MGYVKGEVLEPISELDKFGLMVAHYTAQQGRYDIANRILDDLKAETPIITTVDVEAVEDHNFECRTEGQMLVQEKGKPIRRVEVMSNEDVYTPKGHGVDSDTTQLHNLTQSAQAELEDQERIISKGLDAWYETGAAFNTINQKKLYGVAGYKSFEDYCKKRWGIPYKKVNDCVIAARTKDEICEYIEIPPGNVSLYRELHKLSTLEAKVEVWDALTANNKKPTVAALRKAIDQYLGVTPKPKTTATLRVTVEAAELIKASAKQANITTQDLISKLLAKVLG